MLMSILRPTRAWCLTMVILGQIESSRDGSSPSNYPADDAHPVYVPACYASSDDDALLLDKLPPAIASEIRNIEAMRRSIMAGGPIEQWQFETVTARYKTLLKTSAGDRAVEVAIRVGLARITRLE